MYIRIRSLREDADLSQREIAQVLGCSQQTYSNFELGKHEIPPDILSKIADLHKTSVDYLLDRTDERCPYPPKKHHSD